MQNSAEGILVNRSPDLNTVMREIDLKQANYFHKGFLTNLNLHKRIPIVTYVCILLSKCIYRNKAVKAINANGFHEKRSPTSRQFTGGFLWFPLYLETSQVSMEALNSKNPRTYKTLPYKKLQAALFLKTTDETKSDCLGAIS